VPDYPSYLRDFRAAVCACGLGIETLGTIFGHEVVFASTGLRPGKPGVLVFSGFHGEESAGPLGLLRCLRMPSTQPLLNHLSFGVVPVTNPDGFNRDRRYNRRRQEDNWAFRFGPDGKPSYEGRVLLVNMRKLEPYASACFLDMHEDSGAEGYYLYTFSKSGQIEPWHREVMAIGARQFGVQPDGPLPGADDPPGPDDPTDSRPDTEAGIQGGYIPFDHDGSFDDWFDFRGALQAAVSETPGNAALEDRVVCNAAILQTTLARMASLSVKVACRFRQSARRGGRP